MLILSILSRLDDCAFLQHCLYSSTNRLCMESVIVLETRLLELKFTFMYIYYIYMQLCLLIYLHLCKCQVTNISTIPISW